MKKIFIPFIVIISVVTGAVGWSFLSKPTLVPIKSNTSIVTPPKTYLLPSKIPSSKPVTSTAPPLEFANPSYTIDAFQTAVPAKNWFDLLPVMADNVTVLKYGTSCCGTLPKAQAENELSYLNASTNIWNFDEQNPIALEMAKKDPENFTTTFIGTSSNYYAVGFVLNDKLFIDKIILVNDYRIITGL